MKTEREPRMRVAIIGAGPAGLSCALWLHNLGLQPWLLDQASEAGGLMNRNTLANNWVLGHYGYTGPELALQFLTHVAALPVELTLGAQSMSAKQLPAGRGFELIAAHSGGVLMHTCAAIVLATGTRVRGIESLGPVAGREQLAPFCYCGPAAFESLDTAARGRTLIIGGGDNAVENARMLSERGGHVVVAARTRFRAQAAMMESIQTHAGVRCVSPARTLAVRVSDAGFEADMLINGHPETIVAERLHVLTGYEPCSDFSAILAPDIEQHLRRDMEGYLLTDADGRTPAVGIYAAGDVCNPAFPSVVSAIAQGARVAKMIERDLRVGLPHASAVA